MLSSYVFSARSGVILSLLSGVAVLAGCGSGSKAMSSSTTAPPKASSCTTPNVSITHSAPTANATQLIYLSKATYPDALCNDGSPAAYVLRPGAGAANRWVISLEGGGECYDNASCLTRAQANAEHVTSTLDASDPTVLTLGGLQGPTSSANPDFYDATQVQMLYCSSDDWSGAKTSTAAFNASDAADTWDFQGHAIVSAVIADLKASHGLSTATEVLFTGDSAGGVGAYVNVNAVAQLAPAAARFTASSDAAFGNNVLNFLATGSAPDYTDPNATPNEITERIQSVALWNGTGDAACNAAATTPTEQVYCYSAEQLLAPGGTIPFPMFVSEVQQDQVQLGTDGLPSSATSTGNYTTAEAGYVSYWSANMRAQLATTNANVSIFSPNILAHIEQNDPTLFVTPQTFPAGSLTYQQEIGAWYESPCTVARNIAD